MSEQADALHALIQEGEQAFMDGELDLAEARFREVLAADGGHETALNDLAVLLHARGDILGAEHLFLKAALFSTDPTGPLVNLSAIARQSGRIVEATRYLERGLALAGETPELTAAIVSLTNDLQQATSRRAPVSYRAAYAVVDLPQPDSPTSP